jgi:uncharacterized protein YjbI with pentapeptide repeats
VVPKTTLCNKRIVLATFVVVVAVVIVAVVLATSNARDNSVAVNVSTRKSTAAPSLPPELAPTLSPTPTPTFAPTGSPTILSNVILPDGRTAFTSTAQLYQAVDDYLALQGSNASLSKSSNISLQYGYPMGAWDVSRLTNFSRVFDPDRTQALARARLPSRPSTFNEDLRNWDVSNAVTMEGLFAGAISFVGVGLEYWNVSRVQTFAYTFAWTSQFNGNISGWDTSNAVATNSMFAKALAFDRDLSRWDMSNVETTESMFLEANEFTGHFREGGLELWNVSRVINMMSMFEGADKFRGNLSFWDTGRVTRFAQMVSGNASLYCRTCAGVQDRANALNVVFSFSIRKFWNARSFDGDLSQWNVQNAKRMDSMFSGATSFRGGHLTHWNTSNVVDMSAMFSETPLFNGSISTWDVSKVYYFVSMFQSCRAFNGDLSAWDTRSAEQLGRMFHDASSFAGNLSSWNLGRATNAEAMVRRTSNQIARRLYHCFRLLLSDTCLPPTSSRMQFPSTATCPRGTCRA